MRHLRPIRLLPIAALMLALLSNASAQSQAPADLDAYAARVLKEFEVPGLAVAIVKDGSVVLAKGYGVRKQGEPAPVDEHTLFGIASNTKAFTAAALAMLVDEGKISWDDPVTRHLPAFQLYDPYVTREMTIRDLLTHRSGLAWAQEICCGGLRPTTREMKSFAGFATSNPRRVFVAAMPTTTCST